MKKKTHDEDEDEWSLLHCRRLVRECLGGSLPGGPFIPIVGFGHTFVGQALSNTFRFVLFNFLYSFKLLSRWEVHNLSLFIIMLFKKMNMNNSYFDLFPCDIGGKARILQNKKREKIKKRKKGHNNTPPTMNGAKISSLPERIRIGTRYTLWIPYKYAWYNTISCPYLRMCTYWKALCLCLRP